MLVGRIDSSGDFYQYFHDGLGSITMIVDSAGEYQNLYTYDDFGDFRKRSEDIPNSYCYTGQERDEEPSGLYNLRARYYAAGMGRFTQEDPVFGMKQVSASCCGDVFSILNERAVYEVSLSLYFAELENPQFLNRYVYVYNNPLNYVDPTGKIGFTTVVVGGAVCYGGYLLTRCALAMRAVGKMIIPLRDKYPLDTKARFRELYKTPEWKKLLQYCPAFVTDRYLQ